MTISRRLRRCQILVCLLIRPASAFLIPSIRSGTAPAARDDVPINPIFSTREATAPGPAGRRRIASRPSTRRYRSPPPSPLRLDAARPSEAAAEPDTAAADPSIWERLGRILTNVDETDGPRSGGDPAAVGPAPTAAWRHYVQVVSGLRVGVPSLLAGAAAKAAYPTVAMGIAGLIHDAGVFDVVANDYSQYIQNVLTTSGLVFSLLIGQTYYFMYQQQEAIYLALFEEVTVAKSLLEQVALVCQGREALYHRILSCIDSYIRHDLVRFNEVDPAVMLSSRPVDDPLEDILYLTSVGEPSIVYQTVRSLRLARARRLGALQRKLPPLQTTLLWVLAGIELCIFPLLGAGAQTIGGPEILRVQAWYLSFIVFGVVLVMGVINELQKPSQVGAYNARTVLMVMVAGLEQELRERLDGTLSMTALAPSVDGFVPVTVDLEDAS